MDLTGFALIVTAAVALYNIQQIKLTLKEKGFAVEVFTGWLKDYRQFKDLARTEPDPQARVKLQKVLNGLHFSLAGMVFLLFLVLRDRL